MISSSESLPGRSGDKDARLIVPCNKDEDQHESVLCNDLVVLNPVQAVSS